MPNGSHYRTWLAYTIMNACTVIVRRVGNVSWVGDEGDGNDCNSES